MPELRSRRAVWRARVAHEGKLGPVVELTGQGVNSAIMLYPHICVVLLLAQFVFAHMARSNNHVRRPRWCR